MFHLPFCYSIGNWLLFVTEKHLKVFKFVERLGVMPQYLTNELAKVKENIAAETGFNFHSGGIQDSFKAENHRKKKKSER